MGCSRQESKPGNQVTPERKARICEFLVGFYSVESGEASEKYFVAFTGESYLHVGHGPKTSTFPDGHNRSVNTARAGKRIIVHAITGDGPLVAEEHCHADTGIPEPEGWFTTRGGTRPADCAVTAGRRLSGPSADWTCLGSWQELRGPKVVAGADDERSMGAAARGMVRKARRRSHEGSCVLWCPRCTLLGRGATVHQPGCVGVFFCVVFEVYRYGELCERTSFSLLEHASAVCLHIINRYCTCWLDFFHRRLLFGIGNMCRVL